MSRLWKWYEHCLYAHPYKTQIISSGVLWGAGDVAAQAISHSTSKTSHDQSSGAVEAFKINWRRAATTSLFGFGFIGPVGHIWYEGLDRLMTHRLKLQPKSARFVGAKLALDGIVFAPLYIVTFFSYMGFTAGKSAAQVKEDVKRDFLPALGVGLLVAPAFQVINFRFVPVRYQLSYVNAFCLLDSAFLSWIEQQKNAPWKKWFTSLLASEEEQKEEEHKEE